MNALVAYGSDSSSDSEPEVDAAAFAAAARERIEEETRELDEAKDVKSGDGDRREGSSSKARNQSGTNTPPKPKLALPSALESLSSVTKPEFLHLKEEERPGPKVQEESSESEDEPHNDTVPDLPDHLTKRKSFDARQKRIEKADFLGGGGEEAAMYETAQAQPDDRETMKDRAKRQRIKGESAHGTRWKSETEMQIRNQYD